MSPNSRHGEASLVWIGSYKLVQGLVLAVVATGLLTLVNGDLQTTMLAWVKTLHFDADNRHVAALLHKAGLVDEKQLEHLGGFTFAYGVIFMIEGCGLIFKKRWAEYLTLIITLSFVPLEIYELAKHFTLPKVVLLVVNVAIAVYLIVMLRRKPAEKT